MGKRISIEENSFALEQVSKVLGVTPETLWRSLSAAANRNASGASWEVQDAVEGVIIRSSEEGIAPFESYDNDTVLPDDFPDLPAPDIQAQAEGISRLSGLIGAMQEVWKAEEEKKRGFKTGFNAN